MRTRPPAAGPAENGVKGETNDFRRGASEGSQ